MKILVTGAAGFIGSHLVDALIDDGHSVAAVDDFSTGKEDNLNSRARLHVADVTDIDALGGVFARETPRAVFHLAAQTSVRRSMAAPAFDANANVLGTINTLQSCVEHGVQRIVFSSTCAVYSEPLYLPLREDHPKRAQSAYGMAKLAAESYVRFYADQYGLRYKILRYGNVFGPRQDPHGEAGVVAIFANQMLEGAQPTIFGDGSKTRDYVYVDDVASANLLAMAPRGDNDVYNIARGIETTDFQIFDAVRAATGASVEPAYRNKRPGEADRIALDCSKAGRILGWTPKMALAEGVALEVDHIRRTL